jgi:hypothetical protein
VGIVNDAVQYRIAEGGIGNDVMPLRHGDLTCDQQGSLVVAIVDDLKQITALVGGERFGSPVVEDEEIDALERGDQARQTAFAARLGEIGEQAGCSLVEDGKAVAAGTAEAGSIVKLFDRSTQIGTTRANASGNWTYATAELPEGTHSFTATATDAAGNSSSGSSPLNVKVDAVGASSSPSSPTPTPRGENLQKNGLEARSTRADKWTGFS